MSKDHLNNSIFQDADKARAWLESHLWADGPVCGYCGSLDATAIATRPGYYQCNACRKQFTVMVGTLFERSHVPLNKWLMAAFLLCASKKGVSAHQMHRMLGVTYKTAWFMMHRLREAMNTAPPGPLGQGGGTVEADETYFQTYRGKKRGHGGMNKRAVVALVQRGGEVRSFHVKDVTAKSIREVVGRNISREAHLRTDEARVYTEIGWNFASHETVKHSDDEYVRGDVHTNTIEGFFSVFKRGMKGVYQHCSDKHLQRYLNEFDFRYSNRAALEVDDKLRTEKALKGIVGKRLTYRRTNLGTYDQA